MQTCDDISAEEAVKSPEFQEMKKKLRDPALYAEDTLGMTLHPKQAAVLRDLFKPTLPCLAPQGQ